MKNNGPVETGGCYDTVYSLSFTNSAEDTFLQYVITILRIQKVNSLNIKRWMDTMI